MHIAPELQEQVVLDEGRQGEFRNDLVDATLQEEPEPAAGQVLQGAGRLGQGEQGFIEVLVLLDGERSAATTTTTTATRKWVSMDFVVHWVDTFASQM